VKFEEGSFGVLINTKRVQVSRRDAFLALFGVTYILLGYSFLNIDPIFKPLIKAQLRYALEVAPIEVYGWAWVVAGSIAVLGGLWHKLDGVGFAAATFMPLIWSLANWGACIDGIPRAWVGGVIYGVLGLSSFIISGVPDPRDQLAKVVAR
jgi:hypothetical protein